MMDTRDWKAYWVTKLKDGNCWMTQNLDYDDPNSTKVSAPSGWTSTDASYRAYYDPGDYYLTTATGTWTACDKNTGLKDCTNNTWLTAGDQHYHAGNYYSWQAATNGTGSSAATSGAVASDSICPAGWQLPSSNNTNSGSFGGLTNGLTQTTLRQAPYYFIPGGYVDSGNLLSAGRYGYYWSSTASSGTNAYYLYFDSSGVRPSYTSTRYSGQSVRCLVQGS